MNDHDLITTMRESFTDVQSATPVEQVVRRSQVIRARRRISGAVAVVAVAAAASTAVALTPSGAARPAPVATLTTAYVVSHVTRALDAMPDNAVLLIRRTTVPARYVADRWASGNGQSRIETFTPAGQALWEIGISVSGSGTRTTRRVIFIDYHAKTWWHEVDHFANNTPEGKRTCGNAERDLINENPREMAAQLRMAQSCGDLKVVSSGTVGGVHALKLSGDFNGGNAVTYWVNATTYLPFRFRWVLSSHLTFLENLRWLLPTAANLAKVNAPIPAGFTQVPPGRAPGRQGI